MKTVLVLVLLSSGAFTTGGGIGQKLCTKRQASMTPIESRILHLRAGALINNAIMNGSSFAFALV